MPAAAAADMPQTRRIYVTSGAGRCSPSSTTICTICSKDAGEGSPPAPDPAILSRRVGPATDRQDPQPTAGYAGSNGQRQSATRRLPTWCASTCRRWSGDCRQSWAFRSMAKPEVRSGTAAPRLQKRAPASCFGRRACSSPKGLRTLSMTNRSGFGFGGAEDPKSGSEIRAVVKLNEGLFGRGQILPLDAAFATVPVSQRMGLPDGCPTLRSTAYDMRLRQV